MALIIADLVKEYTASTGTGAYQLGISATQNGFTFRTFSSKMTTNDTTFYRIIGYDNTGVSAFEVGEGTYNSAANTLARTRIIESSTGSAINWGPGNKEIAGVMPAERYAYLSGDGTSFVVPNNSISFSQVSGLQSSLDAKAPLASPTFTGTVTVPDGSFSISKTTGLQTALDAKANLGGAAFTGNISTTGTLSVTGATTLTGGATIRNNLILQASNGTQMGRIVEIGAGDIQMDNFNGANFAGVLRLRADGGLIFEGAAERMRIDGNGNVGIGTISPGKRLNVSGGDGIQINGGGTNTARLGFFSGSNVSGRFMVGQGFSAGNDQIGFIYNQANAPVVFGTNDTERLRIDASGNLLVGATSGSQNVFEKSNASAYVLCVRNTNTTSPFVLQLVNTVTNSSGDFLTCDDSQPGSRMRVLGNGNLQNANNVYGSTSDISIKTEIEDADLAAQYADVMAMRLRKYNNTLAGGARQLGMIAQELHQTSPGLVDTTGEKWSINYSVANLKLLGAFQHLATKVSALEAEIAVKDAVIADIIERLTALEASLDSI